MTAAGVDQVLAGARQRAGLEHATCHQLRHTCLTRLQMSRIAFDASFCSLRERRVPGVRGHGAAGGQVGDLARHA